MSLLPKLDKVYFYLNINVFCGYCRWVLPYIDDNDYNPNVLHIKKVKCTNPKCSQYNKIFELQPMEASIIRAKD